MPAARPSPRPPAGGWDARRTEGPHFATIVQAPTSLGAMTTPERLALEACERWAGAIRRPHRQPCPFRAAQARGWRFAQPASSGRQPSVARRRDRQRPDGRRDDHARAPGAGGAQSGRPRTFPDAPPPVPPPDVAPRERRSLRPEPARSPGARLALRGLMPAAGSGTSSALSAGATAGARLAGAIRRLALPRHGAAGAALRRSRAPRVGGATCAWPAACGLAGW